MKRYALSAIMFVLGYAIAGFAQDGTKSESRSVSNETKPDCVIAKTWDERSQSWIWLARIPGRRVLGAEKKEEQANKDCMKYLRQGEKGQVKRR